MSCSFMRDIRTLYVLLSKDWRGCIGTSSVMKTRTGQRTRPLTFLRSLDLTPWASVRPDQGPSAKSLKCCRMQGRWGRCDRCHGKIEAGAEEHDAEGKPTLRWLVGHVIAT
ncbi:hypothetical protein MPTK1_2g11930 [Marchantia polymorpha subsp. ruderalis]|uniref:Uncharacterized protein n=1 Tax=Marchantia polymorpha TaxID=3197 RepID=A0A2R6XCM1_MARPO|nr:hypothetical protein MARPO_0023s0158 [Marchantia polymorpha]BBN02002.1 hypothetical protein Mp_2g11930 [Marchantia polymorpha subsp. ruderalis]|eukprot:PTQ43864.1 hypothetical protein MARPO_0023s0158 [Marchantia polymorpha]